jgi:acetyl-CoA C-acetyltransferase
MRSVSIVGIGQSPVGELWNQSARQIAHRAIAAAISDAGVDRVDALFVGNMLSGSLLDQEHLATLVADYCGLQGIEAAKVEAACASGSAALRLGTMAVASGFHDVVVVAGVEKMTDTVGKDTTAGLDVPLDAFAGFSINAHRNGANNPNAMFKEAITLAEYVKAPLIATPINMMDSSPVCDGAAALVLVPTERVHEFTRGHHHGAVQILASASANDTIAVHDRKDPLFLQAGYLSSQRAMQQAGITHDDLDLFEVHDAFTIMSALSLEACGFAARGEGWRWAQEDRISVQGQLPLSTMGGLKSRGHPVGATGVYQIVELVQQLTGRAGANQVANAQIGMAQNIGGSGATIVTHILGV